MTSADLQQLDELIVHNVPYQGDASQPTTVWLAPQSAPIAGDMIVSDADWQTLIALHVHDDESYRSADYTRSDPGHYVRVWQLNVDADPTSALAIALGIAVDAISTPTPTPFFYLDGLF